MTSEREAIRQEIYAERERHRRLVAEKPLAQVIREVREASGSYQPIEIPEPSGPRFITYWERRGGISALRTMVVPERAPRDNWGRPIR
jgi:hypothetical protein